MPHDEDTHEETFDMALHAFLAITSWMRKPTYKEISKVLDCMRHIAESSCQFTTSNPQDEE